MPRRALAANNRSQINNSLNRIECLNRNYLNAFELSKRMDQMNTQYIFIRNITKNPMNVILCVQSIRGAHTQHSQLLMRRINFAFDLFTFIDIPDFARNKSLKPCLMQFFVNIHHKYQFQRRISCRACAIYTP